MSGINKLTDTKIKKTQPSDKIIQLGGVNSLQKIILNPFRYIIIRNNFFLL